MNLEIGGQRYLKDYKNLGTRDNGFNIILQDIPINDNSLDNIYWSHVIEHIPPAHIEDIFRKFYKKLKIGGCLRTVCPDLEQMVEAYINNDVTSLKNKLFGTSPIHYEKLGVGGLFVSKICTTHKYDINDPADENLLYSHNKIQYGNLSHVGAYDFNMLELLCKNVGFSKIERTGLTDMELHKEEGQLCVNAWK